eukprot:4108173-Prymnesium_polylepis.2
MYEERRASQTLAQTLLVSLAPERLRAKIPQTQIARRALVAVALGDRYGERWRTTPVGEALRVDGRIPFKDSELTAGVMTRMQASAGWPPLIRGETQDDMHLAYPMIKTVDSELTRPADTALFERVTSVAMRPQGLQFTLASERQHVLRDDYIAAACAGGDFRSYSAEDARKATWHAQLSGALRSGERTYLYVEDKSFAFAVGLAGTG